MSYSTTITYNAATSVSFDTEKVAIVGGALQLKDLGGGTYSTSKPIVTSQFSILASLVTSFAEASTKPANTSIDYQMVLDGVRVYYNTTEQEWLPTSNTVQDQFFNSAAVVHSNITTLMDDALQQVARIGVLSRLVTTSASATPILTSNTLLSTYINGNAQTINECLIYAYLSDLLGSDEVASSAYPVKLIVSSSQAFMNGSKFILPFSQEVEFGAGPGPGAYAEIQIIETETPGIPLEFAISYFDGRSIVTVPFFNAIVPNQATVALVSLATVVPYSFG